MRPRTCRLPGRVLLAAALTALGSLSPTPAAAQLTELQAGARVRLRAAGIAGQIEGVVDVRTPGAVFVTTAGGGSMRVPLGSITSARVSRGRDAQGGAIRGFAWGTGIGLAAGALSLVGYDRCDKPQGVGCDDMHSRAHYVAVGLASGAVVGTTVGALIGVERWERLDLGRHIALRPDARGTALVLTRTF